MVLLDILIAVNFIFAFSLLLGAIFNKNLKNFTLLPKMLLASIIYGLLVNVYTTRLILTKGAEFNGMLVRSVSDCTLVFGTTGLVICFIIFILLNAIHTLIVAKGNTRIAEVAARFTLDSFPGKLMAIEAELEAGIITKEEAALRKEGLQLESDFFDTLDGMVKFFSGNVKIGIIITIINVLGGIIIGTLLRNEPLNDALKTYASLTIGSGIFSMVPVGMVAMTIGIIVSKEAMGGSKVSDVDDNIKEIEDRKRIVEESELISKYFYANISKFTINDDDNTIFINASEIFGENYLIPLVNSICFKVDGKKVTIKVFH